MKHAAWIIVLCALMPIECAALDVLVNQAGYEPNAPKIVRCQRASDYSGEGTFSVKRASDNAVVYSGTLTRKGGLWGKFYWEGDFTELTATGDYYISATVDSENGTSYGFAIAPGALLEKTGKLAYQYFTAQRCGTAVSLQYVNRNGNLVTWSHNSCHTDDGYISSGGPRHDAVGGWHDAGDYGKYGHGFAGNPVFDLLWLYDSNKDYYDAFDTDSNGIADILDEALWQARWLAKIVQPNGHVMEKLRQRRSGASWVKPENDTDRIIGTSDDRWIDIGGEATPQEIVVCASLIRMHRVLASKGLPTENFAQKALDIWNHRVALALSEGGHNNLGSAMHHIFAGIDLYAVFGIQDCWDRAVRKVDEMSAWIISNPTFFDSMDYAEGPGYDLGALAWFARTYPTEPVSSSARIAVQLLMDRNINHLACPVIGLVRRNEGGQMQYFPANPSLGLNRLYGLLTWGATEAYKTIGDPAYLRFALDQYNWILGANYHRVCMMEAAGDYHVNKYHTRYDTFVTNGIEPGVVTNGYIRSSEGLPWVDFGTGSASVQTNEGWLPNNSAYAMALASMKIFDSIEPPGSDACFADTFPYPDGSLNGNRGWTGTALDQITVDNGAVKFAGGATAYSVEQQVSCGGPGEVVGVWLKAKKGSGAYILWNLRVDDPEGRNLARYYGSGTTARGRIGGGTQATPPQNLTGSWDDLYIKIDFNTNATQFVFNGASIGVLNHSEVGAGDAIGRLQFERENNASAAGGYVHVDDLIVGPADVVAPAASISGPSVPITRTGPVSYTVNFSEKVYGFISANDIQVNSTGTAAAGSISITGSGFGPYTVTLSKISGSGTLGITVKSGAANDVASNPNVMSSPSTVFKVATNATHIGAVKELVDNEVVWLEGKALYMKHDGFGYIEETDRTAGIRVEGAVEASAGNIVSLSGIMATRPGGERYVLVDEMETIEEGTVEPLGMNNRALADDAVCGLRVRAWGKVKPGSITSQSYVVSDGSNPAGIRVITHSAPGVNENQFVTVTGAAGLIGTRVIYVE